MMAISTRMFGLLASLVFILVEVTTAEPVIMAPMGGRLGVQQQFAGDLLPTRDCELICRGFCKCNGPVGGALSLGSGCNRECDCSYYYKTYPSWFQSAPVLM